ncbi:hypothetical protein ACWEKJ_03505 [Amycolatopsis thermoflava]
MTHRDPQPERTELVRDLDAPGCPIVARRVIDTEIQQLLAVIATDTDLDDLVGLLADGSPPDAG